MHLLDSRWCPGLITDEDLNIYLREGMSQFEAQLSEIEFKDKNAEEFI